MSDLNQAPVCQSCAMPLKESKDFGQNNDGSASEDYCCHCWKNGKFTYNSTLEQAIEANLPFWREGLTNDDDARALIREVFSKLKRWE